MFKVGAKCKEEEAVGDIAGAGYPALSFNWDEDITTQRLPEAAHYLPQVDCDMTPGNIIGLMKLGYARVGWGGDIRILARHAHYERTKGAMSLAPAILQTHGVDPDVSSRLSRYCKFGVIPLYRGLKPKGIIVSGFPYRGEDSWANHG